MNNYVAEILGAMAPQAPPRTATGHTCLVSGYMLISHCVNPCTSMCSVYDVTSKLQVLFYITHL